MSDYIDTIKQGDHIEFLSDRQTDKGPCTGSVQWILNNLICINLGQDDYIHLDLPDLKIKRVSLHHRTGRPLYFAV